MHCNYPICDLHSFHSVLMNDRRGHRKLRLTSRKHFKPKPKRGCDSIPGRLSQEPPAPNFKISLPLEAYVDAPVKCLSNLLNRLRNCGAIPSGTLGISFLHILVLHVFWYMYRMDERD